MSVVAVASFVRREICRDEEGEDGDCEVSFRRSADW